MARSTSLWRPGLASLIVLLAGCVTEPKPPETQVEDAVLSEARPSTPTPAGVLNLRRSTLSPATSAALSLETDVVYVSLAPDSTRGEGTASIRNKRLDGEIWVTLRDGGFDPVPVPAVEGDSIIVSLRLATGSVSFRKEVPIKRRPTVVRTSPSRSRTGVPLNMHIRVVFSEPLDPATVTPSTIQVTRGGTGVPGVVRIVDAVGLTAAFIPSVPFAPNAEHRLEIGRGVRDRQGDELGRAETVLFVTGTTVAGPPAYIRVTPDTAEMTSLSYQMSATVHDEAGNELVDEPVVWSVEENSGIAISQTGLVTAFAEGNWLVIARLRDDPTVGGSSTVKVRSKDPAVGVSITPAPGIVALEDTLMLTAIIRDASARSLQRAVTWSSSDPSVAVVEASFPGSRSAALVTRGTGSVTITATSAGLTATSVINVTPPRSVASITLPPEPLSILASAPTALSPTLRDAGARLIFVRSLTWTSDDPTIAEVDATGTVTGRRAGTTTIRAEIDGVRAQVPVTVSTLRYVSVTSGRAHSCALSPEGVPYCWGSVTANFETQFRSLVPVAVPTDIRFRTLGAGGYFTCGLTDAGAAFCWGINLSGLLGNGSVLSSTTPVQVQGNHVFESLAAGTDHACGLTAQGAAWCWGSNSEGQLGTGTSGGFSSVPVRAAADLTFTELIAGVARTCGLAADGTAWCWGLNSTGQLGIGSISARSAVPVQVASGFTFERLGAGSVQYHSCAVATGGAAFCWGLNNEGQLGSTTGLGTTNGVPTPTAVSGGLAFATVDVGNGHTCGLASDGRAYCWGGNSAGRLGTGRGGVGPFNPFDFQAQPVAVAGGISFAALSAGGGHTCGMSVEGVLYCWGFGGEGQLGRGSFASSNLPLKVGGQP